MQELSGGGAPADGSAPQRIEAGPGSFEQGGGRDPYSGGTFGDDSDRTVKPWQRGPTGAAAPWQSRGRGEDRERRNDNYPPRDGGAGSAPPWASGPGRDRDHNYPQQIANYGAPPPPGGTAPWQQPPPPPGGQQSYGGYSGYPGGGYGSQTSAFPPPQNMGAPPGLGGAPSGGLGAPPGLGALFQNFGGAPPPPPPGDAPPPPPPGVAPPPPPVSTSTKRYNISCRY